MVTPTPPKKTKKKTKTIDKCEVVEECLVSYRKVKFKTKKCLLCVSVHDESFSDVFGTGCTGFCSVGMQTVLGSLHFPVVHLGSVALPPQTGQNKISTECCYKKIAVGCCHSNNHSSHFASFLPWSQGCLDRFFV